MAVAILGFIGAVNAACGNSGIKVTVNLKYKETYLHKDRIEWLLFCRWGMDYL